MDLVSISLEARKRDRIIPAKTLPIETKENRENGREQRKAMNLHYPSRKEKEDPKGDSHHQGCYCHHRSRVPRPERRTTYTSVSKDGISAQQSFMGRGSTRLKECL